MRVVRTKDEEIYKDLKNLTDGRVAVGWFPDAIYPDGEQVAAVAYKNEFGDRNSGIPMRSFMRTTIHEKENEWVQKTKNLILSGVGVARVMTDIGAVIKGDIQDKIASIKNPPNSAATIKRKGFDDPLVDTSHMLKSISFKTGVGNEQPS